MSPSARSPSDAVALQAGPVRIIFERSTGFLRSAYLGDYELVRAIYFALRRPDWSTVPAKISTTYCQQEGEGFLIDYTGVIADGPIAFEWKGHIAGTSDGGLVYGISGQTGSVFEANRVGLCLLQAIADCAGKKCKVESDDGGVGEVVYPREISPHPVLQNIRNFSYEVMAGVRVKFSFAGGICETEDQRNWGDGSYKTYSPPIQLPFPRGWGRGEKLEQRISLNLEGPAQKILPINQGRPTQISLTTTEVSALAPIGFCLPSGPEEMTPSALSALKELKPAHWRIDLPPQLVADFGSTLEQRFGSLPGRWHLGLALSEENLNSQMGVLENLSDAARKRIELWLVYSADGQILAKELFQKAFEGLTKIAPASLVVGGTNGSFCDLNRMEDAGYLGGLAAYSLWPQVHLTDEQTMVEALSSHPQTVTTLYERFKKSAVISTVALTEREFTGRGWIDPRQESLFAAAWTIGSLARLATARTLHSVTFGESEGAGGLFEQEDQTLRKFPVYQVFRSLAEWLPAKVVGTQSTLPLQADALALSNGKNQVRLLLANFLNQPQEIKIKSGSKRGSAKFILENGECSEVVAIEPAGGKLTLELPTYGAAIVDLI